MVAGGFMVAVAMLATPGPAHAAGDVPGTTLSYKETFGTQVSRTTVGRTQSGQLALFKFPHPTYEQYDGTSYWACKKGHKCEVAARGDKAKKAAGYISDSFFRPNSPSGLAGALMTEPRPAGNKTVAGVASSCKVSPFLLKPKQTETLCTAKKGGFLTVLEGGGETYVLKRFADRVESSFLKLPTGVWDGSI
jgi:hypothetical protein